MSWVARSKVTGAAFATALAEIEAYLERTGTSPSRLFLAAGLKNTGLKEVRDKWVITLGALSKLRGAMADYPAGIAAREPQAAAIKLAEEKARAEQAEIEARRIQVGAERVKAVRQAVEAEAAARGEVRADARSIGTVKRGRLSAESARFAASGPGAQMQALMGETPQAIMRALERRWEPLWARLVAQAAEQQVTPMRLLVEALDAGLSAIEGETIEDLAA